MKKAYPKDAIEYLDRIILESEEAKKAIQAYRDRTGEHAAVVSRIRSIRHFLDTLPW